MAGPLTFGVVTGQHQLTWDQLVEQWQTSEALGFDSAWLFDHFAPIMELAVGRVPHTVVVDD